MVFLLDLTDDEFDAVEEFGFDEVEELGVVFVEFRQEKMVVGQDSRVFVEETLDSLCKIF